MFLRISCFGGLYFQSSLDKFFVTYHKKEKRILKKKKKKREKNHAKSVLRTNLGGWGVVAIWFLLFEEPSSCKVFMDLMVLLAVDLLTNGFWKHFGGFIRWYDGSFLSNDAYVLKCEDGRIFLYILLWLIKVML